MIYTDVINKVQPLGIQLLNTKRRSTKIVRFLLHLKFLGSYLCGHTHSERLIHFGRFCNMLNGGLLPALRSRGTLCRILQTLFLHFLTLHEKRSRPGNLFG